MKTAQYYLDKINSAVRREAAYYKTCAEIEKEFSAEKRFNILFSNTDLLLGALTSNNPKPVIKVRFPKQNAQNAYEKILANTIGEVVERAVIYNNDNLNFKEIIEELVQNALLSGRAIAFLSYEPEFAPAAGEGAAPADYDGEIIKSQSVKIKCIDYEDFRFGYAKTWEKVPWVAVRHCMSRADVTKRFGAQISEELDYSYRPKQEQGEKDLKLACIWEFWDKNEKEVLFVSPGYSEVISCEKDPYELEGFFPMPEPLRFIKGKNLSAVPEYKIYRKAAESLEKVEKRIDALVSNIKANAVSSAKNKEALDALLNAEDSEIITVANSDIQAAGGLGGVIMEYPNEGKMKVVQNLVNRKNDLLETIYGITGISDILRGQTDAQETAKAQQIKGKFGSLRLQKRQAQVQEFIRKIYEVITNIICEHFTQETLRDLSSIVLPAEGERALTQEKVKQMREEGAQIPPELLDISQKPTWTEVVLSMRENGLRSYIIEVESSATAFDDETEDRAARQELFTALTSALQNAMSAIAAQPALLNIYKQLLNFWIDGFKYSRALKEGVNEALNAFEQSLKQPKNPPAPTPEMIIAQAEQIKAQAELTNAQTKAEQGKAELILKTQKENQELEIKKAQLQADIAKLQADFILKQQKANAPLKRASEVNI